MSNTAISVNGVRKTFGRHEVLRNVMLSVPEGSTFAFLGRNGEGKTTTIRMLLGLLSPDSGTLEVDGVDPRHDPTALRARVGYLAEDQRMYGWMTIAETIRFVKPFYPTWDASRTNSLLKDFDLRSDQKVRQLSKGQNVRLGLLLALAHNPRIVVLDDPTLGLDPIMRKDFMRDVIEHLQGNGCTVFFSSHLLYEIEPVADMVAILDEGRVVRQSPTEQLRSDVRQFILSAEDHEKLGSVSSALDVRPSGRKVAIVSESATEFRQHLSTNGMGFEENALNLDEIFEAYVIGSRTGRGKRS